MERLRLSNSEALFSKLRSRFTWTDAALFIAILVVMAVGVGSYGLYEPHEAQYGGGAQEMILRHDFSTPFLDGWPELNKPPLFYWIIALSYMVLSTIAAPEFCARFPQILIAVFGSFVAFMWAYELWGRRAARLAAVMLSVSAGWWLFAHQLLIDELLGTLFLASLYFLWKAIVTDRLSRWIFFYATMALAVLAKGLLGIAFPAGVLVFYILIRKKWDLIGKARPFLGLLILAAIVGPWAYVYERNNPGAIAYMIINEHFNRLFDMRVPHDYEVVQTGAGIFLMITFIWLMPWGLFAPEAVAFTWRQLRAGKRSAPATGEAASLDIKTEGILVLAIGFALVVGFFTVVPSRLVYYALPAIPPFAVLCAGAIEDRLANPRSAARSEFLFPLLVGVLLLIGVPFVSSALAMAPEVRDAGSTTVVCALAAAAGLVLLVAGVLMKRNHAIAAVVAMTVLMCSLEAHAVSYFKALDPLYSSKRLVQNLEPVLASRFVWVTEASEEVGAAGGIYYYLRQEGVPAQVLILESKRRPPPCYPGARPTFLLNDAEFADVWNSSKPVLYVTDFERTDWVEDAPKLPAHSRLAHVKQTGHRNVYANTAASKILEANGYAIDPSDVPEIPKIEVSKALGN